MLRYWDGVLWTEHYAPPPPPQAAQVQMPMAAPYVPPQPQGGGGLRCPHCGGVGNIKKKNVKTKQGVSGGKATGAVLTGGLSLFATGLSRKQNVTEMKCRSCKMVWHVS